MRREIAGAVVGARSASKRGKEMKTIARVSVGLGVAAQLFFGFSPLFLPSMARAEGVAVYPSAVE